MKIRMKTLSCGPEGNRLPGHVYEVPDAEGNQLVNGMYAERVDNPLFEKNRQVKPVELAVDTRRPERRSERKPATTAPAQNAPTQNSQAPTKPAA